MGSYMNFKNLGDPQPFEGNGGKSQGNFPLARQSSIYNLTFGELQTTFSGLGKDFGSMNMDELLKNIWTAEETQATTTAGGGGEGDVTNGNLQKQASVTLPRTLSQKTVDEVWKDLLKESNCATGGNTSSKGGNLQQGQQTLGEMTLEEFLLKAGVVREDAKAKPMGNGFHGESSQPNNNINFALGYQQLGQRVGVPVNGSTENTNLVANQPVNIALNTGGVRPSQRQVHAQVQQQHPLFLKHANMNFASNTHVVNNNAQLARPGTGGGIGGFPDPSMNKIGLDEGSGLQNGGTGMVGFRPVAAKVLMESPTTQVLMNGDTSSLSPSPYGYGQGTRGRKSNNNVDKVIERRHRRMIKNRESAARSRARKQAYTLELESEITKLKELNNELQKKQAEIMKMEKDQILHRMGQHLGGKRLCLRRTLTGPW